MKTNLKNLSLAGLMDHGWMDGWMDGWMGGSKVVLWIVQSNQKFKTQTLQSGANVFK